MAWAGPGGGRGQLGPAGMSHGLRESGRASAAHEPQVSEGQPRNRAAPCPGSVCAGSSGAERPLAALSPPRQGPVTRGGAGLCWGSSLRPGLKRCFLLQRRESCSGEDRKLLERKELSRVYSQASEM